MVKKENGYEIREIKIVTGGSKRGGKRQTKKKNNNSTREKVVEHNPAPVAEGLSDENETQTDHHSATFLECQPLPPDELYFKNTEFTTLCKIHIKCFVSGTVDLLKKLTPDLESPELEWFKNHPQFCHIFHMPDEPNLRLLGMWSLLLRTIPLHEGDDTAWFAVNGVPIRVCKERGASVGKKGEGPVRLAVASVSDQNLFVSISLILRPVTATTR
ncbi:Uncharacterized protein Rs2_18374 [Raphanus sativus]|nr:Uncharacterized protein Rs2_18374 [Raphanus sativus]